MLMCRLMLLLPCPFGKAVVLLRRVIRHPTAVTTLLRRREWLPKLVLIFSPWPTPQWLMWVRLQCPAPKQKELSRPPLVLGAGALVG